MKNSLLLTVMFTLCIYFILTLPTIIAMFTMDFETGQYYGYIYPWWGILICSGLSVVIARIIIDKYKI